MRQPRTIWMILAFACVLSLAQAGCEITPPTYDSKTTDAVKAHDQAEATPESDDPAVAAVKAHAELLAAAQRNTIPAESSPGAPAANEVMWLEPGSKEAPAAATEPAVATAPPVAVDESFVSAANTTTPVHAEPAPTKTPIVQTIYDRIDTSDATSLDKALRLVSVNLADPSAQFDDHYLASLDPEQQHGVRLYFDLMRTMRDQLVADGGRLDRDVFASRLDELFGQQPITIRDLRLCRKVNGFGVFEPFESTTFLAGREQRMIVYVELDDFASRDRGDGMYSVELQQEITLYSSDGLAVWRNEPVQVTDLSANRRRDFFVVQLVKLPDRLSVGKYRLKVRVTDLQGGSIDERGLDLDFVADHALVEKPTQETAPLR